MQRVKFEDIATRVNTREDKDNTSLQYYVGGDHIESRELVVHQRGLIKGSTIGPMFYFGFKKGDILVVSRNPHLRKAAMVDFDGICSEKTFVIGTKDERVLLQRYLAVIVQSDSFWDYCEEHKSGGVNFFVNWSTLAKYEFDLPDLKEQKRISDQVWAAYNVKESYRRLISATNEIVKSRFIEQFAKCVQSQKLGDVVKLMDDKRKPINDAERQSMKTGELYPYYGATGQVDMINSYLTDDTLLCIAEDCGNYKEGEESSYIITGKAWVNNHAHLVKPNDNCDITFLHYYLTICDLTPYVTGTTRQKLTQKRLVSIPVIFPSIGEQRLFVSIVQQADKSKFELKQAIEKIDKVMRALMQ